VKRVVAPMKWISFYAEGAQVAVLYGADGATAQRRQMDALFADDGAEA
jgi:hypothetical protein